MIIGQSALWPSSTTVFGGAGKLLLWSSLARRPRRGIFWVSAVVEGHNKNQQNHYAVLGIPSSASFSDIKKAYRLLARKWHPDVNKDLRAVEAFKSIHLAYQVLSNEATKVQYDRVLKSGMRISDPVRRNSHNDFEFENEDIMRKWSELRQKMRNDRYRKRYGGQSHSFNKEPAEKADVERGSFFEVLQSVFLSITLMTTFGCQSSLIFSSLTAWFDEKVDAGYKMGYLIAWLLGGKGGVLLSLCLSLASWICGKNSSKVVTLVVIAMWVGSNILRYAPVPQGALLVLVYMSIKLQVDLS